MIMSSRSRGGRCNTAASPGADYGPPERRELTRRSKRSVLRGTSSWAYCSRTSHRQRLPPGGSQRSTYDHGLPPKIPACPRPSESSRSDRPSHPRCDGHNRGKRDRSAWRWRMNGGTSPEVFSNQFLCKASRATGQRFESSRAHHSKVPATRPHPALPMPPSSGRISATRGDISDPRQGCPAR